MKKINKGMFVSIAGGIVLLLQIFGLKIDAPYVNEIIEAVCALLIVLGLVTTNKSDGTEDAASGEAEQSAEMSEFITEKPEIISEPASGQKSETTSETMSKTMSGNKED